MSEIDYDIHDSSELPLRGPGSSGSPRADPAARRRVVLAGHTGDSACARDHLAHPDPHVRAAALGALERIGELDAPEVTAGLGDPHASVRRRSADICSRRTDMTSALLDLLADPDPMVVETAAFALGEQPPATELAGRVTAELAGLVRGHEDSLCREAAVAALGSLGDPDALDAVLVACGDRATVRRRAVLALAAFDGREVTEMLTTMAEDRDLQVRQAAEDLLAIEAGEAT